MDLPCLLSINIPRSPESDKVLAKLYELQIYFGENIQTMLVRASRAAKIGIMRGPVAPKPQEDDRQLVEEQTRPFVHA